MVSLVHMLLREDGGTCRHAPDQGQHELGETSERQCKLTGPRVVDGAKVLTAQPDAARCAADEFDDAFAGQGLQVLLCGIGRLEPQFAGDFGPRGRRAGAGNGRLDQFQDLLLPGGELGGGCGHVGHGDLVGNMGTGVEQVGTGFRTHTCFLIQWLYF